MARTFVFEVGEMPIYGGRKLDGWFGPVGLNAKAFSGSPNSDSSR
jgi:hypothetical protein